MRRRALLLTAALLAVSVQTAPGASAAGGSVIPDLSVVNQTLGNGVVSVAVCTARAVPGPLEVPVVTSVWCDINGFQSPTISVPGANAAVVNGNATVAPVKVCVHALAVFSPTIGAPYTATGTKCLP